MRTIEFETQVENGIIKIPKNITEDVNNKKVKILIKVDRDKNVQINYNMKEIEKLLKKIYAKNVFNSIENPVNWQKKIRDEWE
ncbi:MAG: hypothetical protein FVQ77_15915 [Cytophagales bacterium]|nr:hypothetical protein [Cytophagales bacterium]